MLTCMSITLFSLLCVYLKFLTIRFFCLFVFLKYYHSPVVDDGGSGHGEGK